MAKKKRKPAPKAPLIRQQVDSEELVEDTDPLRPDPDAPPVSGAPRRPSVYSEWLNVDAPRPSARSEWLNTPMPTAPAAPRVRPTAAPPPPSAEPPTLPLSAAAPTAPAEPPTQAALAAAALAVTVPRPKVAPPPAAPAQAASPTAPAPAGQDLRRGRRSTKARKLSAGERLSLDPEALAPNVPVSSLPPLPPMPPVAGTPGLPPQSAARMQRTEAPEEQPRPTRMLPAMDGAPPAAAPAPAPRRTAGHMPATLGETTTRIAIPPSPTGGPAMSPRRATGAQPIAGRRPTGAQPIAGRRPTGAQLSLTHQDTAHDLPAQARPAGALAQAAAPAESSVLIRGARHPRPSGRVVPKRLRPPSILMQGFVAAVTLVVLLGALTITSPLGYGAAISGTFQSYASAMAWVPTPTPTRTPILPGGPGLSYTATNPGTQVVLNDIKAVFGPYAQSAINVSKCESGWDPLARNPYPVGNSHAEGVFQILFPSTWDTTSWAAQSPYNYDANIHAAYQIFSRDGFSWREWECQP